MQAMLRQARTVIMPHNQQPTCIRIGLHTGSVVRWAASALVTTTTQVYPSFTLRHVHIFVTLDSYFSYTFSTPTCCSGLIGSKLPKFSLFGEFPLGRTDVQRIGDVQTYSALGTYRR